MKETLVAARQELAAMLELLTAALATHQQLTAAAVEQELALLQIRETDSPDIDQLLANQRTASSFLREALYELENVVLRLEITVQLFDNLYRLDVEACEILSLAVLKASIGELCGLFAEFPKTACRAGKEGITQETLKQLDETLRDVNDILRATYTAIEQTDDGVHGVYKESLTAKACSLPLDLLPAWLSISAQLVKDLEAYTTTQREDLMLWQKRTEYAYTNEHQALATKAWQRKEEYSLALAKIEEALVIHVEISALAGQRLN